MCILDKFESFPYGIKHLNANLGVSPVLMLPAAAFHQQTISSFILRQIPSSINYLCIGQIYSFDNPLLRLPLAAEQIKPRLLGHWGTSPGQNFIYIHLNRLIKEHDADIIYISGSGLHQADARFQHQHPDTALTTVAYFSMEFMLSEALSDLFGRTWQRGRRSDEGRQ